MFRVNQKVVCVDAEDTNNIGFRELIEGAVYTIKAFDNEGDVFLREKTLLPEWVENARDMAFRASRFRPIVDRKTDISVFQEILRKVSSPSPVDAEIGVG